MEADDQRKETGLRYNEGKLLINLIPIEWTLALAEILTAGARKYAKRNWEKGLSWDDTLGCLKRHLAKWEAGESYDTGTDAKGTPNTGCHHMALVAWNALALMTHELRGIGTNDLPDRTAAGEVVKKIKAAP